MYVLFKWFIELNINAIQRFLNIGLEFVPTVEWMCEWCDQLG